MHDDRPSRTAYRVAVRRALHQKLDRPPVLDDPMALKILGEEVDTAESHGSASMRAFMAARARFAEDELAAAYAAGVRQCVVLGAGLDTFAYRNPFGGLRVIEVDHPATQAWKRELLAAAGIAESATFVPVDFTRQNLALELALGGFGMREPAFFSWLGVVPYLSREAAFETLGWIASLPASTVVFDYAVDPSLLNAVERAALEALSERVARAGEPFQLFFEPDKLAADLSALGFCQMVDLSSDAINGRYFAGRADGLRVRGNVGRMIAATSTRTSMRHAWTRAPR
jgi:methyltransferase (TIGR00027 family)